MQPARIKAVIGDLPFMRIGQAEYLYRFLLEHRLTSCLELGFYHGVSSAYIAGAIEDMGSGRLVTIDKVAARKLKPNISRLLAALHLDRYVEYYFEPVSYLWRLMRMLENQQHESFDFCYVDGGHSWYITGFATCLVTRLLRPGGWVLFDDVDWSYDKSSFANSRRLNLLPEEERTTPQVRKAFELLVKQDAAFCGTFEVNGWAFARKKPETTPTDKTNS